MVSVIFLLQDMTATLEMSSVLIELLHMYATVLDHSLLVLPQSEDV